MTFVKQIPYHQDREGIKAIRLTTAIAHQAGQLAQQGHDHWVSEMEKVDHAIELFKENKLSPGHFSAALKYRDYLWAFKHLLEKLESIGTDYLLENDYFFEIPESAFETEESND